MSKEPPPVKVPTATHPLRAVTKLPCIPHPALPTACVSDTHTVAPARVPPILALKLYLAVPRPPPLNDILEPPLVPWFPTPTTEI